MKVIFTIIVVCFLLVGSYSAVKIISSERKFGPLAILNYLAGSALLIGITAFLSPALLVSTGFNPPDDFEWPTGSRVEALQHSSGKYIVAVEPASRIQVYSKEMVFETGFQAPGLSGAMNIFQGEGDNIVIFPARSENKYTYDLNGNVLQIEERDKYPYQRDHMHDVLKDTNRLLWPFTHPFKAWFVAMVGLTLSLISGKIRKIRTSPD